MAVTLKNQKSTVIDALRASRNADDEVSRLRSNSWEEHRVQIAKLVESRDWRHGSCELIATFPHHAVVRNKQGALLRVEWKINVNDFSYELGKTTIFESAKPASDIGHEVMETAKAAVDLILADNIDQVRPMIASIAEALDSGGDLQRRINTEVTLQTLNRQSWWHEVAGEREGIEDLIPAPTTEGETPALDSVKSLLGVLREAMKDMGAAVRALDSAHLDQGLEAAVRDIAEDVRFALATLSTQHSDEEALKIYEAVMSTAPRLLNGIAFIIEMADGINGNSGQE